MSRFLHIILLKSVLDSVSEQTMSSFFNELKRLNLVGD